MGQIGQAHWKNRFFSILLLCGSLVVSSVVAEIVLRLLGHNGAPQLYVSNIYLVDDPVLDWRYIPNSEFKLGHVIYKYNKRGFRDVDHAVVKPPGITRIVVVGDSVTEGAGVSWNSVFSGVLQAKLGDKFEIINIAASGLNTPQEIHLFEKEGLFYTPDLVVLNFVLNDCDFYSNFKGSQRYQAKKDSQLGLLNISINPRLKRLLKSSALIYFLKERIENLKGKLMGLEETNYYKEIWEKTANRREVEKGFDQLARLGKKLTSSS